MDHTWSAPRTDVSGGSPEQGATCLQHFPTVLVNLLGRIFRGGDTCFAPGRRRDSSGEVWSVMLRFGIAGLALAAGVIAAAAQDMKSPRIAPTDVDWDAVAIELRAIEPQEPFVLPELMAKLNRATSERFANIAASPVPVLLPFDTAGFMRDRAAAASDPAAASANAPADNYLFGFNAMPFFYPGPAGYDAVVVARAQEMRELGIGFSDAIYIHIGGSALVYELD